MQDMPPLTQLDQMISEYDDYENRKEPHIVFISHKISRMMKEELEKRGLTFNEFVQNACEAYLLQAKEEDKLLKRYIAFSDLQLTENK